MALILYIGIYMLILLSGYCIRDFGSSADQRALWSMRQRNCFFEALKQRIKTRPSGDGMMTGR
jgi:hypothetical protein